MKINVGVIFGGNSTEHDISVISAVQAMKHIDTKKYEVIPIYMAKDNSMYTSEKLKDINNYKKISELKINSTEVTLTKRNNQFALVKTKFPYNVIKIIDIALPIMHGYNTEDGCVAGYLELIGIPYCQSDIYASVIAQDKILQKAVLKENKVNVLPYLYFYESDYEKDPTNLLKEIEKLKYPVIVKPSRQGSSVGIGIAHNKKELSTVIEDALNYDEKILVEKFVKNLKELNISVLGDNNDYELSLIEEVYGKDELLSFEDKYMSSPTKGMASAGRKVPADIPKKIEDKVNKYALLASKALNVSGVVRIDFIVDNDTDEVYLNELNITPGSLAFYLWTPKDVKYEELLDKIIKCGIKKYQNKIKKSSSFDTKVLENFNGTKGVKGVKK